MITEWDMINWGFAIQFWVDSGLLFYICYLHDKLDKLKNEPRPN